MIPKVIRTITASIEKTMIAKTLSPAGIALIFSTSSFITGFLTFHFLAFFLRSSRFLNVQYSRIEGEPLCFITMTLPCLALKDKLESLTFNDEFKQGFLLSDG